jgi:uncharacterized protein YfdQ (DUF2303 family)
LLATLADDPLFGFDPGEQESMDTVGRMVVAELQRRSDADGGSTLVILDNVSEADLLSGPETDLLPAHDRLHFLATTRLGEPDFPSGKGRLGFLALGGLTHLEGMALIRDHQPRRAEGLPDFADEKQESAAADLVALLDGFTLALEQVAIYLGIHPETSPGAYLADLHAEGLTIPDQDTEDDPHARRQLRHREGTIARILAQTLADLDPATTTALHAAALLPPESVPWPWLEDVIARLHPEPADTPHRSRGRAWLQARRTLEGRRLLTPTGSHPELARIHRLHAQHLAAATPEDLALTLQEVLLDRAGVAADGHPLPPWEYLALVEALTSRIPQDSGVEIWPPWSRFLSHARQYLGATILLPMVKSLTEIRRDRVATQPVGLDSRHLLCLVLRDWAGLLSVSDPDHADALYREATDACRTQIAADPGSMTYRRLLGLVLKDRADLLRDRDPASADALYQEATDTARLVATQTDDLDHRRSLGFVLGGWAWLLQTSDPARSDALYQEATDTARLVAIQSDSLENRRNLSTVLRDWARLLRVRDPAHADALYQEATNTARDLVAAQPDNLAYRSALGTVLGDWARLLRVRDPAHADALYQEATNTARDLVAAQPDNLAYRQLLGTVLGDWANLRRVPDSAHANALYQEATNTARDLVAAQPDNLAYRQLLGATLGDWANLLGTSDPDRADALYQEATNTARDLVAAQPDNLAYRHNLGIYLGQRANLLRVAEPARADALYREATNTARVLVEAQPDNLDYRRSLGIVLFDHARFLEAVAASSSAYPLWVEACQLWTWLASRRPLARDEQWVHDQACGRIGQA